MDALALETTEDVRDALANLLKIHEVVLAENKELKVRLGSAQETIQGYRSRTPRQVWEDDTIYLLTDARKLLKSGMYEAGRFELEKALDRTDSAWRTR